MFRRWASSSCCIRCCASAQSSSPSARNLHPRTCRDRAYLSRTFRSLARFVPTTMPRRVLWPPLGLKTVLDNRPKVLCCVSLVELRPRRVHERIVARTRTRRCHNRHQCDREKTHEQPTCPDGRRTWLTAPLTLYCGFDVDTRTRAERRESFSRPRK